MLQWKVRRNDVPAERYTERGQMRCAAAKCWRNLHQADCPVGPLRAQRAARQLQTHTGGNLTLTLAKRQQTALAVCRVILAGTAETGAGR